MFDDVISFAITLFLNIALSYVKEYSPKPVKVQHSACSKPWLGTRQGGWETEQVSLLRLQNSKPVHVWLRAWAGLFFGNCNLGLLPWQLWISQFHSRSDCFWECLFLQITKFTTFWIRIQERNKLEFRLNKLDVLRFKQEQIVLERSARLNLDPRRGG